MSRGFKAFLVASALFLWFLGVWTRGPGVATEAVAIVAVSVAATVAGLAALGYAGVLVHELGHALAAVALTPGTPLIEIGAAPRRVRFSLGRIDAHLSLRPGQAHCICPSPPLSRARKLAISAAGPAASAMVAGGWFLLAARTGSTLALLLGVGECLHAIVNLFPQEFQRPDDSGRPRTLFSDGAHIAAILRNRPLRPSLPAPAPAPAAAPAAPQVALGASPRGQAVVQAMLQAARAEEADAVGTEHLLRALGSDGQTRELLRASGWTADPLEADARGGSELPPPTPALRRVLDKTRDALSLSGHTEVEPEHFLLALFRAGDNSALASLRAAQVDFDSLRSDVVAALARRSPAAS